MEEARTVASTADDESDVTRAGANRSPPGGPGWIRRRSKCARTARNTPSADTDAIATDETDSRSPESRTPPPSGTVARPPQTTPHPPRISFSVVVDDDQCEPTVQQDSTDGNSIRSNKDCVMIADDGGDDDADRDSNSDDKDSEPHHHNQLGVFGTLAASAIDTIEAAVSDTRSYPEPEGAHACGLASAHRLARLDGIAERLVEAAAQHRQHKARQPDGCFSKLVRRKARNTKANEFVRERFRIAQGLGKHFNELFHIRSNRFAGGPDAAPATTGFRAKMALFWLDTLVRFDRTFNVGGDLPAPSIHRPLSAREMAPLCDDAVLAEAALTDKFDPPDDRARVRKRPPPRSTARVDFSGPRPQTTPQSAPGFSSVLTAAAGSTCSNQPCVLSADALRSISSDDSGATDDDGNEDDGYDIDDDDRGEGAAHD